MLPIVAWSGTFDETAGADFLKKMIALSDERKGEIYINELDNLKQKIEALPKPVRGDRKNARKLNEQALTALNSQQDYLAKQYWFSAHQSDPADVEITNNLGLIYLKLGDDEATFNTLAKTLLLSPGRSIAWINLAEYYAIHDRPREAVACYNLAFYFSKNPEKIKDGILKYATPVPIGSEKIKQAALAFISIIDKQLLPFHCKKCHSERAGTRLQSAFRAS